jgi:hypothetical protein
MPDRRKHTAPTVPGGTRTTVTRQERKAQVLLLKAAGELSAIRTVLLIVHARLGEGPEDTDMGENLIPDSVRVSVRGTIECVVSDSLDSGITALEKAALDTPETLAREWSERLAEQKRLFPERAPRSEREE